MSNHQWSLTDAHKWTHASDEVLIVKCVNNDGTSYGEFQWPLDLNATVEAPDWRADDKCGGGLHGWPWGLSVGDGKEPDYAGTWLVFGAKPADVVSLDGKCKARAGVIRYVGSWTGALAFVLAGQMELVYRSARGAASATGARGAASATGWSGAASATGLGSKAQAGPYGCIALAWWNEKDNRAEMRCARIGCGDGSDDLLKACVWYEMSKTGEFVEVSQASEVSR